MQSRTARSDQRSSLQQFRIALGRTGRDLGTDDDIMMRDGMFFTNSEVKKQPLAQRSADFEDPKTKLKTRQK